MSYDPSSYPYDTVVQITDTIDGQGWQGSGVLISPDEVLTASHLIYIKSIGTADDIVVTPGDSYGNSPYGSADGSFIHYYQIDDADRSISNDQSQFDYAVIHLATPFSFVGFMGLESNFSGGAVNITGYPGSYEGAQVDSSQIVTPDPNYTLLDGVTLGEGSSGGPVWVPTTSGPMVVGIVSSHSDVDSTGYNTLITSTAFNQIESWVQQDDSSSDVPITGTGPHDIATFDGSESQYTISYTGNDTAIVTSIDGTSTTVTGDEVLQFSDQPYFIESGDDANIARLYSAGLGRIPDPAGLFGWEDDYASNVSTTAKQQGVYVSLSETSGGFNGALSIADGFIDSPEFVSRYGPLSNAEFLTQLYQNVLGRGPDAIGFNGWLADMTPGNASGTTDTRAMVLVGFAESPENIARTASWMTDMSNPGSA